MNYFWQEFTKYFIVFVFWFWNGNQFANYLWLHILTFPWHNILGKILIVWKFRLFNFSVSLFPEQLKYIFKHSAEKHRVYQLSVVPIVIFNIFMNKLCSKGSNVKSSYFLSLKVCYKSWNVSKTYFNSSFFFSFVLLIVLWEIAFLLLCLFCFFLFVCFGVYIPLGVFMLCRSVCKNSRL